MRKSYKGFTLIELLVVIAIIGLLSTLAVVALNSARQRSRDAKRVADIRQIQTALELTFSETSDYPAADGDGEALGAGSYLVLCSDGSGVAIWEDVSGDCGGTVYMGLVPKNPDPGGADYVYTGMDGASACTAATGCPDYKLTFTLEGATGQLSEGANCANPDGITSASDC